MKYAASTILVNDKAHVLLMLRDNKPGIADPGVWGFIGGHRKRGETARAAAVREIKEETGLIVKAAKLQPFVAIQTREKKWTVFLAFGNWTSSHVRKGEGQALRFVPLKKAFRYKLGKNQRYVLNLLWESGRPHHSILMANVTARK